jgi:hypothetical protein
VILRGENQNLEADVSGNSALDLDQQVTITNLNISSESNITGKLKTGGLTINASGSSRVEISGLSQNAILKASGASDIVMPELSMNVASVTISGASRANLQVSDQLDVDLSGASDLKYHGDPQMGNIKVSGNSKIEAY